MRVVLVDPRPARRDASWYSHPGYSGRHHFFRTDDRTACGLLAVPYEASFTDAARVPVAQRCKRHGCAEKWPS